MTYECYTKRLMQKVELNMNMILDEKPKLINSIDRGVNHPVFQKYSFIPFLNPN